MTAKQQKWRNETKTENEIEPNTKLWYNKETDTIKDAKMTKKYHKWRNWKPKHESEVSKKDWSDQSFLHTPVGVVVLPTQALAAEGVQQQ
jgi:hypothetical protein